MVISDFNILCISQTEITVPPFDKILIEVKDYMYKDEMIQLHQFLVYVLKYLAEDDQITNDCSEYISLKISPHHIHKTKAEHKHAIFVLCKIIAQVVADKENNSIPDNVRNSLGDLVTRSQVELSAK